MNKADLITAVQHQLGVECSKAHAERTVEQGLRDDGEVQIVGFGTFAVKHRKARMGRNPQTKEPIEIKASKTVAFRAGTSLRGSV